MTNKTTKSLATAPKRTVKKAKLAGIELPDSPTLSAAELQTQIRRRAYELYLQRSPDVGNAEADWLQAEYEVTAAISTTSAAAVPAKVKAPRAARPRSSPRSSSSATATPTRTRRKQPPATSKS